MCLICMNTGIYYKGKLILVFANRKLSNIYLDVIIYNVYDLSLIILKPMVTTLINAKLNQLDIQTLTNIE